MQASAGQAAEGNDDQPPAGTRVLLTGHGRGVVLSTSKKKKQALVAFDSFRWGAMDLEALTPVHYLAGDRCEMADERIVRDVLRSKDSQVMGYLSGPFLRDGAGARATPISRRVM